MKRTFFAAICIAFAVAVGFIACKQENNTETTYKGTVVNKLTSQPFPNLEVKVTDGEHINQTVHTDASGFFSLLVRFNEINSKYYLLVGDSSCVPVRKDFKGFGQKEIDLGIIEVEGPKAPTVTTSRITEITAETAISGGNVTDDGRITVTARGVCWSEIEYPTINDAHTTNGAGKGEFQSQLTNLKLGTTYYVRAYATNRTGTNYGEQISFTTTTGLPTVTTNQISNISATSAMGGGSVDNNSGYPLTARGICWSDKTATPTIDNEHTIEVATTGLFNSLMVNLEPNKTYYVRAYASNEKGTGYGEMVMFSTLNGLPTVEIATFSNLKATQVQIKGTVTADGGFAIKSRGFCYSNTSSIPTISDKHTEEIADLGAFTCNITDLIPGTRYYVRAYANNEMGIAYSQQITFVTQNGLPMVKTNIVKSCTETTAIIESESFENDEFKITERGVCWDIKPNPTITNSRTSDGMGVGIYESYISDIDIENVSNTYYVRAYATNENGTAYGNELVLNYNNLEYEKLPRIDYDGYIYVLFHDIGSMPYDEAVKACDELKFAGYDDWELPHNSSLLKYMMNNVIDGWKDYDGYMITYVYMDEKKYCSGRTSYWTSRKCDERSTSGVVVVSTNSYSSNKIIEGVTYIWVAEKNSYYDNCNTHYNESNYRVRPIRRYKKY